MYLRSAAGQSGSLLLRLGLCSARVMGVTRPWVSHRPAAYLGVCSYPGGRGPRQWAFPRPLEAWSLHHSLLAKQGSRPTRIQGVRKMNFTSFFSFFFFFLVHKWNLLREILRLSHKSPVSVEQLLLNLS